SRIWKSDSFTGLREPKTVCLMGAPAPQSAASAPRTCCAGKDPLLKLVAELPMRWSNVALIFRREVRDQLRDRRTLFMIFVLPILLYPALRLGIANLSSLPEQKPR